MKYENIGPTVCILDLTVHQCSMVACVLCMYTCVAYVYNWIACLYVLCDLRTLLDMSLYVLIFYTFCKFILFLYLTAVNILATICLCFTLYLHNISISCCTCLLQIYSLQINLFSQLA